MTSAPPDRRLLAVFAHPDDETYGVAGLLARLGADPDAAAACLCLTRGEASSMGPARGLTPTAVGALRTERMHRVAAITQLAELRVGDFPDGGLAKQPVRDVAAVIAKMIESFCPQVLVTHCARGVNGHPDHIATHWAVRRAVEDRPELRLAMVAYRTAACEAIRPHLLFPTADDEIDVTIRLSANEIRAKEQCLRVHEALTTVVPERARAEGLMLRPAIEELDLFGERLSPPSDDPFYGLFNT